MKRWHIFCVQIAWLIGLGILAGLYFVQGSLHFKLGPIPVGVVWFGALGAVLISLTGIVEHAHDWDPGFNLWHLSRPLVGAALAVVAVLIVQAGVLAAGAPPSGSSTEIPKYLLYYLVAFLVGYREETFRDLLKRVVDLILTPAPAPPAKPTINSLAPATAPAAGGSSVKILGSGFTSPLTVSFGSAAATFKVDSDTQISATLPSAAAAGSAAGSQVTVTVKTKAGSATAPFEYTS
jgi:IPT/TIG domain-containing protein